MGNKSFVACHDGDTALVRHFLDHGGDINIKDEFHPSLAGTAISMGHTDILGLLIERGLNVNAPLGIFGQRPLHHIASAPNTVPMARLLLNNGANPNIQDKYGVTPIQAAAGSGNLESLELLMAAGADPRYVSPNGRDAFYAALMKGNLECIERLMAIGGNINAQDNRGKNVLSHNAMVGDDIEMVKWLLAHGADKSIPDDGNAPPLDWARQNGHHEIVKLLE